MKKLSFLLIYVLMISFAYADLGDFPDNMLSNGKFKGNIVVGEGMGSVGIISANVILSSISEYIEPGRLGVVTLDSDSSLGQDMIVIGNPCENSLTAELYGNPDPCDKDYINGEAYIKYVAKDGNDYIIIAGLDSNSARKAAERLANYGRDSIDGNEVVVEVDYVQEPKIKGISPVVESEQVDEDEPLTEGVRGEMPISKKDDMAEEDNALVQDENHEKPLIVVEDKGLFEKIIDWFMGMFR